MSGRDYLALARQYEDDVLAGVIPACKWVRLACARNRRDLARVGADDFPYVFDEHEAVRRCQQAEMFPHIKGPKARVVGRDEDGRPRWATIELEPHQCWFLATLFGWRQLDGLRRFRVANYFVPRKNAKTTLAAIIALLMLVDDGESGAECYSAATTRDQAKVVAEIAWEMASRLPEFREYFGVKLGAKTTRTLSVPALAGKFGPLSADAGTLDALNISFAVIDELHAHRTRAVYDVIDTATGARPQPLLLITSTAGVDIGGICYEKLQYLLQVLEGFADEQLFGVYYTIDEGDDWRDPAVHRKANPNYGVSVSPEDLARKVREAERSPAGVNNFLTKHLNVWVRAESTWMPMDQWRACGDAALALEDFAAAKVPCWIGVDLAETRDIMAKIRLFRVTPEYDDLFERLGGRVAPDVRKLVTAFYVFFGTFYLPEDTIEQSPIAQVPGWVAEGHLVETPGNIADYGRLEADIVEDCDRFEVKEICFDRALAAAVMQSLQKVLGEDPPVVVVKQSVDVMDPAMKAVERLVLMVAFRHDANPVMTWMVSNVVVERNYKDEIYPRKAGGKDSHNKIDGAIALFNAMSRAFMAVEEAESVYASRGLATL